MKPVQQLFALIIEQLPDYKRKPLSCKKLKTIMIDYEKQFDIETAMKKKETYRCNEVKKILFDPFLNKLIQQKNNNIMNFFQKK